MDVPGNQATHLVWVGRNHEVRSVVDRRERCNAHAFAKEGIGTLHRRVT